jgi:hypothetical protein
MVAQVVPLLQQIHLPLHDPRFGGDHTAMHRGKTLLVIHRRVAVLDRLRILACGQTRPCHPAVMHPSARRLSLTASKSCFTLAFSCSSSSKEARFHSDVLHTSCASAGWFSLENIPKAASPAKAFDAKLRRVKSFISILHFTCTGASSSRNLLDPLHLVRTAGHCAFLLQ